MKAFTNDNDTFVAEDKEDLVKVLKEHYGDPDYIEIYDEGKYWTQLQDSDILVIFWYIDAWDSGLDKKYPGTATVERLEGKGVVKVSARIGDWITVNGRGFLCSTEW